jgi:hypothetical protein
MPSDPIPEAVEALKQLSGDRPTKGREKAIVEEVGDHRNRPLLKKPPCSAASRPSTRHQHGPDGQTCRSSRSRPRRHRQAWRTGLARVRPAPRAGSCTFYGYGMQHPNSRYRITS